MRHFYLLLLSILLTSCAEFESGSLQSPDSSIEITLNLQEGQLFFNAVYNHDTVITKSPLRLDLKEGIPTELKIGNVKKRLKDETWSTINGKNLTVRDYYHELEVELHGTENDEPVYSVIFRCYNDGFAYRYSFLNSSTERHISLKSESSQINFPKDFTWWSYNGENHNVGPEQLSTSAGRTITTPMVAKLDEDCYLAIHEAEIIHNAPLFVKVDNQGKGLSFLLSPSLENTPYQTSWRSFMLGQNPGDLVESNLLVNLNEPCMIEYPEWIKPGKAMWDWRVWGYVAEDGFEYGLNTISHKRFIDFASENNIQYLLIDADWYGSEFSETSDPTSSRKGVDIVECMRYAKDKDVGVILYLNDVGAKKFGLERVLKQFADWGAAGVKYGFMRGSPADKVLNTREIVELCAKYKLMVNFHDNPIPPSGDRRTWPNLMTKEFGHSQADAKKSYYPETAVTAPFINMIAGPLDMCEGWFGLTDAESRVKVFEEIPGTVAAEVAKLIVNYSGWKILPDSPEEYLKKDDLFDCIRQMPPQFDSFNVNMGEIGEYISVVRRSGNDYFVGMLTNRQSRELEIKFDFLEEGFEYEATLYEDTETTHFMNEKESYQVRKMKVNSTSSISVFIAPGGGHSMMVKRL